MVFFPFVAEMSRSSFWRLSRGWWYRPLSLRCYRCDGGIVALTYFVFTEIYMVFCIFVLFCLDRFFTAISLLYSFCFSLKAGVGRVDCYFVAGGIVICHYDKLRCHLWGCQLDDILLFGARLTWHSHPVLLWYLLWNVHGIYVCVLLRFDNFSVISL